jgi:hypothetical protein
LEELFEKEYKEVDDIAAITNKEKLSFKQMQSRYTIDPRLKFLHTIPPDFKKAHSHGVIILIFH